MDKKEMQNAESKPIFKYTKEKLLAASRFKESKDLISAVLEDGKAYSLDEVREMIDKYMKGKVK